MQRLIKGLRNKFYRFQLYRKNKVILDNNKKLENTQSGKRCFIFGTGPSIKDQNLLRLKNEQTFAVNTFWMHPQFKEINPKYYVAADTLSFREESNFWTEKFAKNAYRLSEIPMELFFNIKARESIEAKKLIPPGKIHYIASDGFFREDLKYNMDISRVIPNPKNVVLAAILIATYMGFEEIYLLGCEHDYLAIRTNYELSNYFYESDKFDMNNSNDVKYYGLKVTSYESAINHAGKLFQNYRLLKAKLAKEKPRVKIYNATPNSFLDVFPMVKFEDINL